MLDIILTSHRSKWFWRLDRWDGGYTVEDSPRGYASPEAALADAKIRWEILRLDAPEMAA